MKQTPPNRTFLALTLTVLGCLLVAPRSWGADPPRVLFLVVEEETARDQAARQAIDAVFMGKERAQVEIVPRAIPAAQSDQVLIARGLIVERGVDGVFWMIGPDEAERHRLFFVGANNESPIERDITAESPETTGVSAALVARWTVDAIAQGRAIDHLEQADKAKVEPASEDRKRKKKKKRRRKKKRKRKDLPSPDAPVVIIDDSTDEPRNLDYTPKPYRTTIRRMGGHNRNRIEFLLTPGAGLFTGARSAFSDPSFHIGAELGFRFPFVSVSARVDFSPVNLSESSLDAFHYGIGGAFQLRPLNSGLVDLGLGVQLGYAGLTAGNGVRSGHADFFGIGPTVSLLFRVPFDGRDGSLLIGPRATWQYMFVEEACVGSSCTVAGVKDDGYLDLGLSIGYSGGM